MAADCAGNQVELRRQAVFASAILQDLARPHHRIELVDQSRPHALALESERLEYGVGLERLARLGQIIDQIIGTRDRVLVRLALARFLRLPGVSGQVLRLR